MDRVAALLTAPLLPAWAVATRLHPRWSRHWRQRWGLAVPPIQPGAVWVHAASVGEIGAAWALVRALPDPVLLTADTDTGVERAAWLARGRPGVAVGARPVDHGWPLAPLWAEARPRAVVFVEGTFWPTLAWRARRAGVPVYRVSAKVGPRTARFAPLLRAWWWPVDRVWARDPASAAQLARLHRCPVEVGGDLKRAAGAAGPNPLRWPGPFVVGASTREGDEERLLAAVERTVQVLLAPRHPERFAAVAAWLDASGSLWARRTDLVDGRVPEDVEVVLLDTVGELAAALVGAELAFIGGTFDPAIGGHSPWEAAAAGVPVVAGPCTAGQGSAFAVVGASVDADLAEAIRRRRPPAPVDARIPFAADLIAALGPPAPETAPRPWLAPLAALYGAASDGWHFAWERGWRQCAWVGVPVISVGSTNARSPGRTSIVLALVRALRARGEVVGVALRGYRRVQRGGVQVSWEDPSADALGDEGALAALAGAQVAAGPDRVAAARALVAAGCTVLVLDDGLQHRALGRDLELVVVDARFPGARGLLPAGERRERRAIPARTDRVLVQHGDAIARRLGPWTRGDGLPGPLEGPAVALAGIGRAADFFASLEVPVEERWALADHQPFDDALTARVLSWAGPRRILCTAKDAARLPPVLRARAAWRDVEIDLPADLVAQVEALLTARRARPPGIPDPSRGG